MQLFIDSANREEIRHAASLGIITGVTTNPSLLAKEEPTTPIETIISQIHQTVGGHLSVEVVSTDADGMIREAEEILSWLPEATIKIPMIPEGLTAVSRLSARGIPTNVTLVFSPTQALAAANAGATYVSVFLGRLDDIGHNGIAILEEVAEIWNVQGIETQIIAASIRHPLHIAQAAKAGADIATVPYKVLMQSLKHPLTDAGLEAFLRDAAKRREQAVVV